MLHASARAHEDSLLVCCTGGKADPHGQRKHLAVRVAVSARLSALAPRDALFAYLSSAMELQCHICAVKSVEAVSNAPTHMRTARCVVVVLKDAILPW